jgi:hypothetical protein
MRKVIGLVACLALTGSIASAFTSDVKLADLKGGAAKMSTPAYQIVPVVDGRGGELMYKVNFINKKGTISAFVDVGDRDFKTVKRLGGHIEVRIYTGDNRGNMHKIGTHVTRTDKALITFPSNKVCVRPGSYSRVVKVWASARKFNGDALPGYTSSPKGKFMRVNCLKSGWNGFTIID